MQKPVFVYGDRIFNLAKAANGQQQRVQKKKREKN